MKDQAINLFLDAEREIRDIKNQFQDVGLIEYINRTIFNEYNEIFTWEDYENKSSLLLRKVYDRLSNLSLCDVKDNKYSTFIKNNQLELDSGIKKGLIHCIADSEEESKVNSRDVIWKEGWKKSE